MRYIRSSNPGQRHAAPKPAPANPSRLAAYESSTGEAVERGFSGAKGKVVLNNACRNFFVPCVFVVQTKLTGIAERQNPFTPGAAQTL
jgi:hypothetical protein